MKSSMNRVNFFILLVSLFFVISAGLIGSQSVLAADPANTGGTDFSTMDWSDESEQVGADQPRKNPAGDPAMDAKPDFSQENWADDPKEVGQDLSNMSWEDDPSETTGNDLSGMSWEDEAGENVMEGAAEVFDTVSEFDEKAEALMERNTHIFGFFLFAGYILGGLLTAYFFRNRKLGVDFPPELLIVLHSVWPLQWLFIFFAGKKVR